MAAALRSSSSATGQTGSTFTVTAPAGIQDGDVLVAFQINSNASAPATPSGFANHQTNHFGLSSNLTMCYFYKTASSESGNYTFNNVNSLDTSDVWLLCLSGCVTGVEDAVTGNAGGPGTTATALSVNTAAANSIVVAGFASSSNTTVVPQGGLTNIGTVGSGFVGSLNSSYLIQAGSGASGNQTATIGVSSNWAAMLLCFSPVTASPPVWQPTRRQYYPQLEEQAEYRRRLPGWLGVQVTYVPIPWWRQVITLRDFSETVYYPRRIIPWAPSSIPTFVPIPWVRKPTRFKDSIEITHYPRRIISWVTASVATFAPINWWRKATAFPLPEIMWWLAVRKPPLPLPLQMSFFTSQEGTYGILNTIIIPAQVGMYRIANDIEGWNVYVGQDALPDLDLPPAAFSTTLPINTPLAPPPSGTRTYYVLVRKQDHYGLESQNSFYQTITIDSTGGLFLPPIEPPQDLFLAAEADEFVHVMASYPAADSDPAPANFWKIWAGTTPPDPLVDVPVAMPVVSGKLMAEDIGPFLPGLIYVAVALWRSTDSFQTAAISGSVLLPAPPDEVTAVFSGYDLP